MIKASNAEAIIMYSIIQILYTLLILHVVASSSTNRVMLSGLQGYEN